MDTFYNRDCVDWYQELSDQRIYRGGCYLVNDYSKNSDYLR